MSSDTLALPVRADGNDVELLESVITFYGNRLVDHAATSRFLARRGLIHPELLKTFELGLADRELGRKLPPRAIKTGRELRNRLTALGIYRASGHGHFNGSLVIPLRTRDGQLADLYGRKVHAGLKEISPSHTWLPERCRPLGDRRGLFNAQALEISSEIILTDSILNALTFWCAEQRNVTCTLGLIPMHEDLVGAFQAAQVKRVYLAQRNTESGEAGAAQAAEVLTAMNIECLRIRLPEGQDANDLARSKGSEALVALVRTAKSYEPTRIAEPPGLPETDREPEATPVTDMPVTDAQVTDPERTDASVINASTTDGEIITGEAKFAFDDRHYRVRGLDKNHSLERMKINLLAERRELVHVDTLDLYGAQARMRYIKHAATELYVDELLIKQDLSKILLQLEALQEQQIRTKLQVQAETPKQLSDAERSDAEDLLRDPRLLDRILTDFDSLGLVGEETNKLISYLACVSRLLERPLALMIQSSSAAGKTTLMDTALSFVPPEHQIRYSAMTGQSLYYMGPGKNLKHKILAVSEEEGVAQASYALKLLQSDGKLRIAAAGKNSGTGRNETETYEVEGPVMMFLTTTAQWPDSELLNRCIVLWINETAAQTAAIHARQSARYTRSGQRQRSARQAICQLHQNAQRLLEPKKVLIPWAEQFTFRCDQTRMRREFDKYLVLIESITLLHQYQRVQHEEDGVAYVTATLEDVDLANRLAGEALGQSLDDLLPQTRQLLVLLDDYVTRWVQTKQMPRLDVRFTQRELREALDFSDRSLRRHLARLVELEYVLPYRTGQGNQRQYQLVYDGQGRDGSRFLLGLIDTSTLRDQEQPRVR